MIQKITIFRDTVLHAYYIVRTLQASQAQPPDDIRTHNEASLAIIASARASPIMSRLSSPTQTSGSIFFSTSPHRRS